MRIAVFLLMLTCEGSSAQLSSNVDWAVGAELRLQAKTSNIGQWQDAPLRPLLLQLSVQRRIPLFIDRRVDPSTKITLGVRDLTWDQLLYEIGRPHGYTFCQIEGVYYFGPIETAISIPHVYGKLNRWVKENRKTSAVNWRRPQRIQWEKLSQPRQLIKNALEPMEVEVYELDSIPFDVWPAADINQLPLHLQVALFAVGFEKWISISKSGSKVKFVPYPSMDMVSLPLQSDVKSEQIVKALQGAAYDVSIKKTGKTGVIISGNVGEVYQAYGAAIDLQQSARDLNVTATFTAELKGKRGSVVATIAQQLKVKLEFDPDLETALSEHIEFDVENATADEILMQALKGTGISYSVGQGKLRLSK